MTESKKREKQLELTESSELSGQNELEARDLKLATSGMKRRTRSGKRNRGRLKEETEIGVILQARVFVSVRALP